MATNGDLDRLPSDGEEEVVEQKQPKYDKLGNYIGSEDEGASDAGSAGESDTEDERAPNNLKSAMKKSTEPVEAKAPKPPLPEQPDASTIDLKELTPLTDYIIARQATINIGTIGHVAHGKSTVVKAISGVQTVRFKNEMERNITIKLGYANAKVYKCDNPECPRPGNYRSYKSDKEVDPVCEREGCGGHYRLLRHVS